MSSPPLARSPAQTPSPLRNPRELSGEENFIPLRKIDLRTALLEDPVFTAAQREQFEQLCRLLEAAVHHDYCQILEQLKDAYAPFDPDADTRRQANIPADQREKRAGEFFDAFADTVDRANFQTVPHDQLVVALNQASALGMNVVVDFAVFERLEIYARGQAIVKKRLPRTWLHWRPREVEVPLYQRLAIAFRLKQQPNQREAVGSTIFLKLFKDIPKSDLEMLLPGTKVRMTWLDQGKIVVPTLSGLALAIHKIVAGIALLTFSTVFGALATLGLIGGTMGYGVRAFFAYLNTKDKYQLNLTRSLYFQNLDNNAGVLFRMLDDAEEQDYREALLAYFLLWKNGGPEGWTTQQLDQAAEDFILRQCAVPVDFEIADALQKLLTMKLVASAPGGRWRAVELDAALATLDATWDGLFQIAPLRTTPRVPHFAQSGRETPIADDWGPVL
jgi:hypothetical protein